MDIEKKIWLADKLLSLSDHEAISLLHKVRQGWSVRSALTAPPDPVFVPVYTDPIGVIGNVWVRQQYYPKALRPYDGHKHPHDHVSLLAKGSLRVEADGHPPAIYKAPSFFKIAAGVQHQLIPLEDDTIAFCIHALRDDDGNVVEEFDGNTAHYGVMTKPSE